MGRAILAFVFAVSMLPAACGDDGSRLQENGASTPVVTAGEGTGNGPLPRVRPEQVFPLVALSKATGLYQAPDGRWFATEQAGRILVFEDRQDARATVLLDISDRVNDSGGEEGLLGFALAPDFAATGRFYVDYTASEPRRTVISRFAMSGPATSASSEEVVLEQAQPFSNHNGGQIAFGPDGFLYIAFGDGGGARDPQGNGQNLSTLLGKVLRIDVSKTSAGLNYAVPYDNPFAGRADARGEVWAYGFRNPWRFSFDGATGQLWVGDVGQNAREEIDMVTKGGNYGWAVMEGSQCLSGSSCDRTGLTLPVVDYAASGGRCSVTGGFVYRGSAIPALRGAYVYGDYCSGEIWALRHDGGRVTEQALVADLGAPLSSFAVDNQGEPYALAYGGSGGVFKLMPE